MRRSLEVAFDLFLKLRSSYKLTCNNMPLRTISSISSINCDSLPFTSDESEFMEYKEAIKKLNSLQTNASVLQEATKRISSGNHQSNNVECTQKYLKRIGLNIDDFENRIVHISGTKGKGSTAMLTESLLRSVPYKTGLFTSPHLVSVRERISINGMALPLHSFVNYFWQVYNTLFELKDSDNDMPTYFKFLTIMAIKVFISENVDVAIIEVGIGGEHDCTNVFKKPPVVGITSIGLDHTSILGDTVEKIAWQKGGIFKPGCKALTVADHKESVLQILQDRALERQCKLEVVPLLTEYSWNTDDLTFPQRLNASLAIQLAKSWDFWNNNKQHISYDTLQVSEREKTAVRKCNIAGRCQIIYLEDKFSTFYLDGAHTIDSMKVAKDWFESMVPRESSRILIFNVTGTRTVQRLLEVLKDCRFSKAIFCSNSISDKIDDLPADLVKSGVSIEQGLLKAQEHLKVWTSMNIGPGIAVASVSEALSLSYGTRENPNNVLITGSLHLVGSTIALFHRWLH